MYALFSGYIYTTSGDCEITRCAKNVAEHLTRIISVVIFRSLWSLRPGKDTGR